MTEQAKTTTDCPRWPHALGLLAFLIALAWIACRLDRPPAPHPASDPPAVFSAERAWTHLRVIASEPHPIGSAAHDRVRDYLLVTLGRLGLRPEIQRTVAVSTRYGVAGSVQNVLARIPGEQRRPAVMLTAHYDSVPAGPGAADDGAGTAALLETARALRAGPPLRHDVILLFTDGEEAGLLGAEAFAAEHPWRADVGVVCNFEARGTSGPSMLFETSPGNQELVKAFARSGPHPAGSSLAVSIYQALPNDTDLTVFLGARMAGLNFAFVEGWSHYHTPQDSPSYLDPGSLQQQGEHALALARCFSDGLPAPARQDAVFFNVGSWLVHYPAGWALPQAFAPCALLLLALLLGFRRGDVAATDLLLGGLLSLLTLLVAGGLGFQLPRWLAALHSSLLPAGDWARSPYYAATVGCTGAAVLCPLFSWVRRYRPALGLLCGALLPWALLTLLVANRLPGGSYLFTWPLLLAGAPLFRRPSWSAGITLGVFGAAAVPAVLLLAPVTRGLFVAMGLEGLGSAGLALLGSLLALLLLPQIDLVRESGIRLAPAPLGLLVLFLLYGAGTTRWDADHPRPDNLWYALDSGTRTALLADYNPRTSAWSARILGPAARRTAPPQFMLAGPGLQYLIAPSLPLPLPTPRVRVLSDAAHGDTRSLRLHVTPSPGAREMELASEDASGGVIAGKTLPRFGPRWHVTYQAPPPEGFDLTLLTPAGQPATFRVVGVTSGLPEALHVPERPANVMPIDEGDRTLVGATFRFARTVSDGPVPAMGENRHAE